MQKAGGVATETRLIGSVCDLELGIGFATRWFGWRTGCLGVWLAGWAGYGTRVVLIRCDAQKEGGVATETRIVGSVCDLELGIGFATR